MFLQVLVTSISMVWIAFAFDIADFLLHHGNGLYGFMLGFFFFNFDSFIFSEI